MGMTWANERRKLGDLIAWPRNPRQINKDQAKRLDESFTEFGQVETIAIGPANEVYNGHQRLNVLAAKHGKDYEVEVRVASRALTEKEREKLTVLLHKGAAGEWNFDVLANEFDAGELVEWGFTPEELGMGDAPAAVDEEPEEEPPQILVGDPLWPTDNEWGIPLLDPALQAVAMEAPVNKWGTVARSSRMAGTWHFYTDDYKFSALWADPRPVVNTRCAGAVEVNFSTNNNMPKAVVLYDVFRKRWLARFWQAHGIRILVDLNVEPCFRDLNLLGVPQGWTAYATRWLAPYGEADMVEQYNMAKERAGRDPLFVVVGGRKDAQEVCQRHGWVWIREHAAEVNDGER